MKIVNDLLSVHEFVVIDIILIKIIIITVSFNSILKPLAVSARI